MKHTIFVFLLFLRITYASELNNVCWAEQTLAAMNLEQKIGQFFVVAAISSFDPKNLEAAKNSPYTMDQSYIEKMIAQYYIGGLLFLFRSTPKKQVNLFNHYNSLSKTPLWTLQDCEWGLQMRLDDTVLFPKQMTLGAVQDDSLLYLLGLEIGKQCKIVGVDINLAPVVDVNNNPLNPVIGRRSFGSNQEKVAQKAMQIMKGMQNAGIMTCIKHFPGHGDTTVDSHLELPIIGRDKQSLDEMELYPFKELIKAGTDAVMVAHLLVSAYDAKKPSSLSKIIVTDLLQKALGFTGLIMTDGLGMKAVTNIEPGQTELEALLAGNDILLAPIDIPAAVKKIVWAIGNDLITMQEIDRRVLKILKAKEQLDIHKRTEVDVNQLKVELCSENAVRLKKQLYQEAITLINNSSHPTIIDDRAFNCVIQVGGDLVASDFMRYMQNFVKSASCLTSDQDINKSVGDCTTVVFAIFGMNQNAKQQFGISEEIIQMFNQLKQKDKKVIVVLFGTPYAVTIFKEADFIVVAYEDDIDAQIAAAKVVTGQVQAVGILPVDLTVVF